jgi:transposase
VESELRADVMGGELYLFVNIRRTGCKVLLWDGTGLCIFMKKLERGRFADLWSAGDGVPVRLTSSELALFIEGCALVGKKVLSPPAILRNELAASDRV